MSIYFASGKKSIIDGGMDGSAKRRRIPTAKSKIHESRDPLQNERQ